MIIKYQHESIRGTETACQNGWTANWLRDSECSGETTNLFTNDF